MEQRSDISVFDGPKLRTMRQHQIDPATGRPWSQTILAYRLREEGAPVSAQEIAKWEKEYGDPRRAEPQGRYIRALCSIFGCSVDDLYRKRSARA